LVAERCKAGPPRRQSTRNAKPRSPNGGQRVTGELAPHSEAQSQTQPVAARVETLCTDASTRERGAQRA